MSSLPTYDLARLLQASAACSLITSVGVAPSYNLPIALYGLHATSSENSRDEHGRTLTAALVASLVADILWLFTWSHATRSLVVLILLANMGLKALTLMTLQTTGVRNSFSGGAGWSMPGSFGPDPAQNPSAASAAQQPASYQGAYSFAADDDDEEEAATSETRPAQQKAAGAGYQAV